ncbi:MAG: translation initiation factor IF-2 [Bacteroidales bacterium]|nr:translation initiation factor IF-2 [Bacteroidales bacterium]MDD3430833.1 translation initiation factor IF-2 [Bacteroidales bacterium]MDD4361241.1 translation initiation factor IF-2 [Bacteroidales bacterium]
MSSVRLNKITRELNVGISTLVEFLQKKGFEVENNPNAKISEEAYVLLVKEFGDGQDLLYPQKEKARTTEAETEQVIPEPAKQQEAPQEPVVSVQQQFKTLGKIDLDAIAKPKAAEPKKTKTEETQPKEEIPTKTREEVIPEATSPAISEQEVTEKAKVEKEELPIPEPVAEVLAAKAPVEETAAKIPVAETPAVKAPVKEVPAAEKTSPVEVAEAAPVKREETVHAEKKIVPVEKEEQEVSNTIPPQQAEVQEETPDAPKSGEPEIFSLGKRTIKSNIKVVTTIDLDALNQNTRPRKKTKQEKLKEQEDKRLQEQALREERKKAEGLKAKAEGKTEASDPKKKKRSRIKDVKIRVNGDYNAPASRTDKTKARLKKPVLKTEVSEEDVSKQIKETLARLTNKPKKGTKYRKEKREAASQRLHELEEKEIRDKSVLKITEFVTVNDLATMMDVPVVKVISTCISIGQMVSINQRLDAETINFVADEFGFKTEYVSAELLEAIQEDEDSEEDLIPRPPIITVMGHVDHGKTSLLDYIRNANVIAGEAGGITQHIGAYNVTLEDGRKITFLDTPGHEAFTAMRARGAKITDIAIIIVAADDNVMPQTIEAINHASAAGVPMVFAINKIDKSGADPERIKQELASMNYLVEEWGGKYQSQDISAKQGVKVKELLEKVLLEAEMLELKANPAKRAIGSIIESTLDKGRGYVATVLVENGTLKIGDIVIAGVNHGRIKAMFNERGQRVESAGPAEPVLILGLNGAPQAGDNFNVLDTEQEAREIANKREQLQREQGLRTSKILTLAEIGRRIAVGNFKELNLIVKGDVDGSIEALSDSLINLSTEQIQVNVIHKAVGQISESDVTLASASDAIIIGFQVRPSMAARRMAERDGVDIRLYSIIYDAIEEIKSAMEGMLSPEIKEEITSTVEVREVFKITKVGTVAGCMVKEGKIKRGSKIRLIRDGIVVFTGELGSLKRFKEDVKEVASGYECGLNINNYNDIKVGDFIEAYEEIEVKKTL